MRRPQTFLELLYDEFWALFGLIWFVVGSAFLMAPIGDSDQSWIFRLVGGAATLVGGAILLFAIRKALRTSRLLQAGIRCEGTVTEVKSSNFSINDVTQWVICFTYRDHFGQIHEAESAYMSPSEAQQWHAGDTGSVRYDPNDSSICLWLGREDS